MLNTETFVVFAIDFTIVYTQTCRKISGPPTEKLV